MSVFYQALTQTPFDHVFTPTSEEQEAVEASIQSLLLPYQQLPLNTSTSSPLSSPSSLSSSSTSHAIASAAAVPVPTLGKAQHIAFLRKILDPLPAPYVAYDSTRCWLIYWVAHSYYLLGEEMPDSLRNRAISTLLHFQDKKRGGFGSGKGQIGHLMATYATIMALTVLGGPGPCPKEEGAHSIGSDSKSGGWDEIDR
jgi:protein farnesyltransferase subunit beta